MSKKSKAIKFIIGLLLLPTVLLVFLGVADIIIALFKNYSVTLFFLLGAGVYLFIHKYIYNFSRLYVLIHELTHAMAALICGHKVQSLKVNEDNGNVKLTGVNVFILLAPYILPMVSVFVVILYFLLALFIEPTETYRRVFVSLFGFFTMFHIAHTYKALTEAQQSDVQLAGGSIFSFSFIVIVNVVIIVLLLELLFPGVVPVWQIVRDIFNNTVFFWKKFFKYSHDFIVWAVSR